MGIKSTSDRALAVFIDFENLALGFTGRNDRFDIRLVLKRLLEKGKIVAKKSYADWNRFASYTGPLHEAAIELVEIPRRGQSGKNSADIRLCVDAMDLAYSKEHIDTFVIVSGDSDFSPLVSKLKELGKHVIGLGMSTSTSNLLRDNCDEFIYYEDLTQDVTIDQVIKVGLPDAKRKAFMLLLNAATALRRENKEILHPSQIKATMQRMKPSFNETYHGYRTFSALLEDAQREGLLILDTDKRSGTYVVTHFGAEIDGGKGIIKPASIAPLPSGSGAAMQVSAEPHATSDEGPSLPDSEGSAPSKPSRGRRRRGGRGRRRNGGETTAHAQESTATDVGQAVPTESAMDDTSRPQGPDVAPSIPQIDIVKSSETVLSKPDTTKKPHLPRSPRRTHQQKINTPQAEKIPTPVDEPSDRENSPVSADQDAQSEDALATTSSANPKKRRSRGGRGRGGRSKAQADNTSSSKTEPSE